MRYTKEQIEQWDEYAVHETLKREGREAGIEIGEEKIILKLLQSGKLTVKDIASLTGISEVAVRKVEKTMQAGLIKFRN